MTRGGALGLPASLVFVALSAALMLAVGARLLGPSTFTGLALTWTLSTVFGLSLPARPSSWSTVA